MTLRAAVLRRIPPILRIHAAAVATPDNREAFDIRPVLLRYLSSRRAGIAHHHSFDSVRFFTFFVGWPRSGHSLFGALLDAHPSFAIAHELDVLPLVDAGFSRDQVFASIVENARAFAESPGGRGWSDYSYAVPGQSQGRFDNLRVVGDKKGGMSAYYLARVNPDVVEKIRRCAGVPIRVILYHRNPYDILATVAQRAGREAVSRTMVEDTFESLVPAVSRVRSECDSTEVIELYHEDFVGDPVSVLRGAVEAFGERATDDYLEAAGRIVRPTPNKTRSRVRWEPEITANVRQRIATLPYLRRYTFES